ncbi:MAG: hypothetical protein WBP11_10430, partial [Dokdonella sp.]
MRLFPGFTMLLLLPLSVFAADVERSVLVGGTESGTEIVSDDNGSYRSRFSYNDRGRGEELDVRWKVDDAGLLTEFDASGNDYMKSPITERFRMVDGKATWTAGGKDGSETLTKPAFYVPTNSPTELLATLARALLKAPQHRLALLPSGEATLAEAGHLDVQTPEGKVKISQYRISGLGFTAQSVWLNADGKTVANASRWLTSIGATYRDALPKLMEAQEEADNAWSKEVAQRLAHTAKGDLLIRNVRLFDPRDLSVTPNSSVLVRGERVIRIGPDAGADAAADVEIVDGKGRFLMPGMWDNHQHFSGIDGLLDLANGVTSARDMANNASLPARVARFDAGTELGPRVLMSGIIDGPGKFAGPTPMLADTPAKAREF